ncbi:MAG TPA: carboxypeptidase regulatory-like domain-containing protein, partial [Puia sp.]|nr:carboxypeptidase regulatory-like domain-containing protein [Puia sp.]
MKKVYLNGFILGLLFFFATQTAISQDENGTPAQPRGGRQAGATGHFYGRIVDAKTNKGIDGVSIQLIRSKNDPATKSNKDSVVDGMITKSKGNFSFSNLPILGSYRLKVTAIGYSLYDEKVAFDLKLGKSTDPELGVNAVEKDLGNIKMQQDAETLNQVIVTGSKPLIQLGIDRKIYNVEKDIAA